ncbi:hypothetical protein GSI_12245 [Ganoderma sinense ZZ0214-1]|uniref:DUF6570 domain-containing protein n=1 Tax=Ganoderma sinense ZZ0214-1 TaxID=1077348 RepID=A0A2G8RYC7_9APHY|nr:hypothetical protein GSI_12245 [Ganoderma sinense ZZ0214-1]
MHFRKRLSQTRVDEDADEHPFQEPDSENRSSDYVQRVLPPPPETIRDTVCIVYVGGSKPTKKTISKFGPALAKKSRVRTMINFLVSDNVHYACDMTFHGFEPRNLDMLFDNDDASEDEAVPCAIDVGVIDDSEIIRAAVSDYTLRDEDGDAPDDNSTLLMENVGYTLSDESPKSYRSMKMKALSHCMNGGRFTSKIPVY